MDPRELVRLMNAAWREGRFDELGTYFAPDAVIVAPGFAARVEGREKIVQTYIDFLTGATIDEIGMGEPAIEEWGDTAVVTAPFSMTYTMSSARYRESGHDVLVLARREGKWLIVWRTLLSRDDDARG